MTVISSRSNPRIKQIRALKQRKNRQASGLFFVEGIRHVGEAVESGAHIESIYYAPEHLTSSFGRSLIQGQRELGIPCYQTSAEVFDSISDKENPQGILALVAQPQTNLADIQPENFLWGVALIEPQDPGNLGAILRTIDGVGASGLLLLDSSVDPYHPSAVRASMGTLFWLPIIQASFEEFVQWARRWEYTIYGTSAQGSTDISAISSYHRPAILLMGSEREGLNPVQAAACQHLIRLPMRGRATSLNLAVATGVLLYDMMAKLNDI
jgi:RNA methyltransferase, TrmH family